MDVMLDANAIRGAGLDSPALKALRAYLRTTRSRLLLPLVVVEELCAHREREVRDLDDKLAGAYKTLLRLFPKAKDQKPVLDAASSVASLRNQLTGLAELVDVVRNLSEDLDELVRRLTRRVPPASKDGEEARDVLIWLTLLPVVRERRVAFVSDDKAFWASEQLRPELVAELGDRSRNLEPVRNINDFLKKFHRTRSFITKEWLEEELDPSELFASFERLYHAGRENPLRLDLSEKGEPTHYTNPVQIVRHEVTDFFVSDADPNELYVGATVWAELEIEVEYYLRSVKTPTR
jgi:hypothetical protein